MAKLTLTLSAGFFVFILWIIYLANTGQQSIFFDLVRLIPYGDKVGHLCLFGTLTLLTNIACKFRAFKLGQVKVFWGSALVFAFVTVEELSQHFVATRTLDIYDYSADLLGITLFTWLSGVLAKQHFKKFDR